MTVYFSFLDSVAHIVQGAAHAVLFAVFGIAGVGKLLGCTRGVRTMCGKSAVDFGCALLGMLAWPPLMLVAGGVALAVGAGGWAIELINKNPACRCFGVMNGALHRFRNHFRCALGVSGAVLLAAAVGTPASITDPAAAAGALFVLAGALLLSNHAIGSAMLGTKPIKIAERPAKPVTPDVSLGLDQHAGQLPDGRPATLADLVQPGQPLAILFSVPGCSQCEVMKSELAPFRADLPFPLRIIDQGKRGSPGADMTDPDNVLRRRLAITSMPTLVVFDSATLAVAAPFATGVDAIRQQIMQLLVRPGPTRLPDQLGAPALAAHG